MFVSTVPTFQCLIPTYHGLSRASSSATRWSFSRSAARSLATILNCGAEKAANGEPLLPLLPLLPLSSPSVGDERPGDASTMVGSDSATEAIVPYVVAEADIAGCQIKDTRKVVARCGEDSRGESR